MAPAFLSLDGHLATLLFFATLSIFVLYLAKRKNFFFIKQTFPPIFVSLKMLLILFGGYLLISFLFAPFVSKIILALMEDITKSRIQNRIAWISLIQIVTIVSIALFLIFYCKKVAFIQWPKIFKSSSSSPFKDIGMGIISWLISFPLVSFFYEISEMITVWLYGKEGPEQSAVTYLKMALTSPTLFITALIAVLIGAPIIEEILFRGFLQTYLRNKLGIKSAILVSSLIFALFHYSYQQGIGNFPLITSLFVLALFLGFIYERQRSLLASIALHMTFNSISVIRIFFMD